MDNTKTKVIRSRKVRVPFKTIRFTNLSSTAKRAASRSSLAYKLRSPATKRHRINIRILKFCTFWKVRWKRG